VKRIFYLDNLRFLLVILVIFHHAGQAYGPGGGWPIIDSRQLPMLGAFFSVNASFFMGLLFFIAGSVQPLARNIRGTREYIRSRVRRLLIPFIFIAAVFFIPLNYSIGSYDSITGYLRFLVTKEGIASFTGHNWFILHLFIYSMLALPVEAFVDRLIAKLPHHKKPAITPVSVFFFLTAVSLLIGTITFIVRIHFPVDRWIMFAGVIRMEAAHLPQYLVFFLSGIFLRRINIPDAINLKHAVLWMIASLLLIIGVYVSYFIAFKTGTRLFAAGGNNMHSFVWSFYESFLAVSISITLLYLSKEFLNRRSAILQFFGENSYGAYLIHVFPMVGFQMVIASSQFHPFMKFIITGSISAAISFAFAALVRQVTIVRRYV